MHRHGKFDHGDDLSTRLTTLVAKLEMLMTTISRNQGCTCSQLDKYLRKNLVLNFWNSGSGQYIFRNF